MVGLESSMDQAQAAKKVKAPKVSAAEKKRQEKFMEQLRARKAPQPKGAKVATKTVTKAKPKIKAKTKAKKKKR